MALSFGWQPSRAGGPQLLDVLLEYPIHSDRSEFAIRMRVDRFGQNVSTALRFLPPEGTARPFEFHGDPGLVRLDPRWHHAAMAFVVSGFWHILEGSDSAWCTASAFPSRCACLAA